MEPNMEHRAETGGPKKLHVASLVLAIIGIVFAVLLPIVAYPLLIVGLVLAVSRRKTQQTIPGLVLCIIGLVVAVVNSVLGALLFSGML
ncbi:MAG: hypothetical protein FWC72_01615 [Oscillospiraceae bacterium]|nr:hypothetical protein [Oscillospiraceae bacterium]